MHVSDVWDDEGFGTDDGLSEESIDPVLEEDEALVGELEDDAEHEDDFDDEP
jgi:hypothetical protein